jgi:hypothetical protein
VLAVAIIDTFLAEFSLFFTTFSASESLHTVTVVEEVSYVFPPAKMEGHAASTW